MMDNAANRCMKTAMSESHFELVLGDSQATEALGAALARSYLGGLRDGAVMYLHGELGVGKTTCVRGLLRALGVDGLIRSPTYTLVEAYQPGGLTCIHVDLYRLQGPVEVDELGLRDYFDTECLLMVEWPEKGGAALPPADLQLTLSYAGDSRQARLEASTARGRRWLEKLVHDTSLTSYVSNLT
jgi:tRNA threonylcarbamoyladenosine biosynthesis protein TsaE